MKKTHIIIIIFQLLAINVFSQNLPNYNFENWEVNQFNNPKGWGTSNFSVISLYTFNPVTQYTVDPYAGNSCVKLETIEKNISGQNVKVAGVLTLGKFDVDLSTRQAVVEGGVSISGKPTLLSGYFKYAAVGKDSCVMSIFLTKYSTEASRRDTLGIGYFSSSSKEEWSYFEAPISYTNSDIPDSMNIVVLSSDTSVFEVGSTLYIDDLFIDATVNNPAELKDYGILIYPNPSHSVLTIEAKNEIIDFVEITDISGVRVCSIMPKENNTSIDVSNFNPGIYFVTTTSINGKITKKKIIVN